ncbi:phage tail protein [Paenibacillus daejeonensis]|uniref:phage tail protein n=1 Tax=Paenibacillus daejeonensis TaxID=135193 RepID=UPI00035E7E34|nr:phage tail protein [Paenibacillus daejeonensis]
MSSRNSQQRSHVVGAYRFMVELDGMLVAGFSEVSGLSVETEVYEHAEGGLNQYVHRLPGRTRLTPLVLRRGMTLTNELWNWYSQVLQGKIVRKSGSIILYDELEQEFRRWNFYEAYPTKWSGPDFNASSSEVALEAIELTHNGFKVL